MKVICIQQSEDIAYTRSGPIKTPENMKVFEGEVYTVLDEVKGYKGEMKYRLAERPPNCRYRKPHFIPLSEVDETELVNHKELTV
jgi:hypothetical protein